ncbi:MAG: GNAT family N-acetyltransferase [Chloroflexi bacterium HGW-Chloroflexi-8]|nr:MAG: GNAT family N-acetyltransferase [Chloroflexi bacterium HGW-Chloroflexi-8]
MIRRYMITLETDRLILRHQVLTDLEDLYALYCDSDITKYIPDAPKNYQETKEELEWHMNGHPRHPELGLWATIDKATNQFIGRCGLLPWTIDGIYEVEVAYTIRKDHWGQGLGSEAAQAILDYGFNQLHLTRLICLIDHDNQASIKVATKIGMTFEKDWVDELGPLQIYSINQE